MWQLPVSFATSCPHILPVGGCAADEKLLNPLTHEFIQQIRIGVLVRAPDWDEVSAAFKELTVQWGQTDGVLVQIADAAGTRRRR